MSVVLHPGDCLEMIPRLVAEGVQVDAVARQQTGNQRRQQEAAALWESRRAEISRLYLDDDWSQAQVAAHYGVSQQAIPRVLRRVGIPAKPKANHGARNGRFKDGAQSTLYRKMVEKDSCAHCGVTSDLCIHHKDDNHTNNTPSNLEILCMSCHSRMHKQQWWDRRKAAAS